MQKKEITFTLNGKKVWVEVKPYEKLLDVLRDKLGVKSPNMGVVEASVVHVQFCWMERL
jgi:Aerobic-type carbon monoxide dehydrogenase, small subunit CoxS/CutS homologs